MDLRLHAWIRELYLAGTTADGAGFARDALARAAQLVPFARARWELLDAEGKRLSFAEHTVAEASARPGASAAGAAYLARFTVAGDGEVRVHRLSFEREAAAADFDGPERQHLALAAEHLAGAEAVRRRNATGLARAGAPDAGSAGRLGHATADAAGRILAADAAFLELLHQAQPGWTAVSLPFQLPPEAASEQPGFVFGNLWVQFQAEAGTRHWSLQVRRDRRALKLSDRELQIAERVTQGFTFKEIANALGVAPSTVSTHLYNLYAKLGIRRRAELVNWLRQNHGAG